MVLRLVLLLVLGLAGCQSSDVYVRPCQSACDADAAFVLVDHSGRCSCLYAPGATPRPGFILGEHAVPR